MKKQYINQRVGFPVFLASIFLIVICLILVALYLPGWRKQVANIQATRTAVVAIEKTQIVEATNTAVVVAEQGTQSSIATLTAAPTLTLTPTPIPSPTSAPSAKVCTAKVSGIDRVFYKFPSVGYKGHENIKVGSPINIIGRWPDTGWYKISSNDKEGWIRDNFVRLDDINCSPTVYTVSYLFGLDQGGMIPLLNDTFAANDNAWSDSTNTIINPTIDPQTGDHQLVLDARKQIVVGSDNTYVQDLAAFYLVTSVTFSSSTDDESSFGIRFRDNGTNYFEVKIFPGDLCRVDVFESGQYINSFLMKRNACISNSYFVELSLNSKNSLNLMVNGYDVASSFNFNDTDGQGANGTIKLIANKGIASFDFITITQPK